MLFHSSETGADYSGDPLDPMLEQQSLGLMMHHRGVRREKKAGLSGSGTQGRLQTKCVSSDFSSLIFCDQNQSLLERGNISVGGLNDYVTS